MEGHRFGLGEYKQVTITEIIWQNGKAEILRIGINSAEHSSSIMNLLRLGFVLAMLLILVIYHQHEDL